MLMESDVYALLSDMLVTVLTSAGPVMGVALFLGLGIAFFQALTQIQEMTLTFVPKIVGIFLGVIATAPFIYSQLSKLATTIFDLIASGNF